MVADVLLEGDPKIGDPARLAALTIAVGRLVRLRALSGRDAREV